MAYRTIGEKAVYGSESVGTTAVELCVGSEAVTGRTGLYIHNNDDTTPIFIGTDDDVSASNGFPVPAGESLSLKLEPGQEVYAIAESSCDVRIIEV